MVTTRKKNIRTLQAHRTKGSEGIYRKSPHQPPKKLYIKSPKISPGATIYSNYIVYYNTTKYPKCYEIS